MLALVNTPNGKVPVELRQVPEPAPGPHQALVAVQMFRSTAASCARFAITRRAGFPVRTSAALCCGKRRTEAVRRPAPASSR